jgi:hypothetical protein
MIQDEQALQELEEKFPSLSGAAFSAAYKKTLEAGLSVLIAEEGYIYEVFPDGTRKKIKKIEPPTRVDPGKPIRIR